MMIRLMRGFAVDIAAPMGLRASQVRAVGCLLCRLVVFASTLLSATVVSAQNAGLSGSVRDAQGAVIADATLKLTEQGTGVVSTTRANAHGLYVFASVKPAVYRLEASAPGFASATFTGIILNVEQRINFNVSLEIASRAESVTVSTRRSLLASVDGSLGTVIDRKFAANLPLRGRSFSALLALTPGIGPSYATSVESGSEYNASGQRADSNYLTIDGLGATTELGSRLGRSAFGNRPASTITGSFSGLVSMDALQEMRVQTSSFAPEFGRTPGAQISLVTRSGTNLVNGSVFEQFRNDAMMATNWFVNNRNLAKAPVDEHQFGASVGGPIFRNRTFFFASYEGLRVNQPQTSIASVPSLEARQMPSLYRDILNLYPAPTGPTRADLTAEYAAQNQTRTSADTWGVRLDHSGFRGAQFFARYSRSPSHSRFDNPTNNTAESTKFARSLSGGMTLTLGSNTLVDVRGTYGDAEADGLFRRDGSVLRTLVPASVPAATRTSFRITGVSGLDDAKSGFPSGSTQWNAVGSVSRLIGAHHLKAGVDYRRVEPSSERSDSITLTFRNIAEVIAGPVFRVDLTSAFPYHGTFQNVSSYLQDSWKASSKLSLTFGVRWDVNPPPTFVSGEGSLPVATFTPINELKMSSNPNEPLWKNNLSNVFPRAGFSYAFGDDAGMTLSGGVGLFGDLQGAAVTGLSSTTQSSRSNVVLPMSDADVRMREEPERQPPFSFATAIDPNLDTPKTTHWNLALEKALGRVHSVTLAYVGANGQNLIQSQQYMAPNSDFTGSVNVTTASGRSNYHAMQLQYRRRASAGPYLIASYTLARSRDTTSSVFSTGQEAMAPSDIDVRNSFNLALSWELPAPRALPWLLQGWGFHAFGTARSGQVLSVYSSDLLLPEGERFRRRASLVPGVPAMVDDPTAPGGRRLNYLAFMDPPAGQQGDTGRNAYRWLPAYQLDLGLQRSIRLRDSYTVKIRLDTYNVFNTPVFSVPQTTLSSGPDLFGRSVSTEELGGGALTSLYRFGAPRSLAVSLRFEF